MFQKVSQYSRELAIIAESEPVLQRVSQCRRELASVAQNEPVLQRVKVVLGPNRAHTANIEEKN